MAESLKGRGTAMTNILDIAEYILQKEGTMTAMKLQKLAYYSQAWSLVWDEAPLFKEKIQAWANGPVSHELYQYHKGHFQISSLGNDPDTKVPYGNPKNLDVTQVETVDATIKHYSKFSAHQLSELTHKEDPWRLTRERAGLSDGERGTAVITEEVMFEYYDSL